MFWNLLLHPDPKKMYEINTWHRATKERVGVVQTVALHQVKAALKNQ